MEQYLRAFAALACAVAALIVCVRGMRLEVAQQPDPEGDHSALDHAASCGALIAFVGFAGFALLLGVVAVLTIIAHLIAG